jgi:hypothetical protein
METVKEADNTTNSEMVLPKDYQVQDQIVLSKTQDYPLVTAEVCPMPMKRVSDISTGGERHRRYAIVLSMGGIPNFQEIQEPITINADMPKKLIDGDSIEDIRARAHAELDCMINIFRDTTDGTITEKLAKAAEDAEE